MRSNRGSSMVFALLILFAVLALGVAGLQAAASGMSLANNYRAGVEAMQAAEAGVVHAVTNINEVGVRDLANEIATTGGWNGVFGTSSKAVPSTNNTTYTVAPATSPLPAATKNNMWITANGQAPGESMRTVNARLAMTGPFTCGAIDMPSTGINSTFNGNSFSVDGRDYAIGSNTPIDGGATTLGISTRTQTDANTIVSSLGSNELDNVVGTPVPNQIPSVGPCVGPSSNRMMDVIVPEILGQPTPPVVTIADRKINGRVDFGTVSAPQITYFNGDTTVKATGNASGAGIMVVNGSLTIQGNLSFTGLIIVIGQTQIGSNDVTEVTGSASVYGAIWTTDLSLRVGGSAGVRYSNQALTLANSIPGMTSEPLPQRVAVTGWSQG